MIEVRQTAIYKKWRGSLRDPVAKAAIAKRIVRITAGNFGDAKPLGGGVSEIRFDIGPGYRVYFMRMGSVVVLLLCAGDKGSQVRDIARAKALAAEMEI